MPVGGAKSAMPVEGSKWHPRQEFAAGNQSILGGVVMTYRLIHRQVIAVVVVVLSYLGSASAAEHIVIRANDAPCGLYLAKLSNTSTGTKVSESDSKSIREWAQSNPKINVSEDVAYVVGTSPNRKENRGTITLAKKIFEENNITLDVRSIRRLPVKLNDRYGLFLVEPKSGSSRRVADLNPDAIRDYLEKNPLEGEIPMLVGVPLFGKERLELCRAVGCQGNRESDNIRIVSRVAVKVRHLLQKITFFTPVREDFQAPTDREVINAWSKLLIPGILTLGVEISKGASLLVAVPVAVVNAINSFGTGIYRTALFTNWYNRVPTHVSARFLKNFILSGLFTVDLYWASRGSMTGLAAIFTLEGWKTLALQKWGTNLFQTLWRMPFHSAIGKRERLLTKAGGNKMNERVRDQGSTLEFYTSLILTQFYIYSATTSAKGMPVRIPFTDVQIMTMDAGKWVMLGVGLYGALAWKWPQLLHPVAHGAVWVDNKIGLRKLNQKISERLAKMKSRAPGLPLDNVKAPESAQE